MFFEHTLGEVRRIILEKFPDAKPSPVPETNPENHILWIVERIEKMETGSQYNCGIATFLLGRVLTIIDHELKLWSYDDSIDHMQKDVLNKKHLPHRTRHLNPV